MVVKRKNHPKSKSRHIAFAHEYCKNGFNGAQAYKKVYGNVTDETAKVNASKLLIHANVTEIIDTFKDKLAKQTETVAQKIGVTEEYILKGLKELAERNLNEKKNQKDVNKAYELMGKHLKMYTDRIESLGNLPNIDVNIVIGDNDFKSQDQ